MIRFNVLSVCYQLGSRLYEILYEAPWSSLDLILSSATMWIGAYLLLSPNLFGHYGAMYGGLSVIGGEWAWGLGFLSAGLFGLWTVLWLGRPSFTIRLLARMVVAFFVLSLMLNNMAHRPPPLSAITYGVLSLASIWGIWRTKASGR